VFNGGGGEYMAVVFDRRDGGGDNIWAFLDSVWHNLVLLVNLFFF